MRFWLLAVAGAALLLVLLAPTALGRVVGGLWVTVMGALLALLEGFIGR